MWVNQYLKTNARAIGAHQAFYNAVLEPFFSVVVPSLETIKKDMPNLLVVLLLVIGDGTMVIGFCVFLCSPKMAATIVAILAMLSRSSRVNSKKMCVNPRSRGPPARTHDGGRRLARALACMPVTLCTREHKGARARDATVAGATASW